MLLPRFFLCLGLAMLLGITWSCYALLYLAPLAPDLAARMQLLIAR